MTQKLGNSEYYSLYKAFELFYLTAMRYWIKEKTRMENTKEKEAEINEQIDKLEGMWKTVEEWYKFKSENQITK